MRKLVYSLLLLFTALPAIASPAEAEAHAYADLMRQPAEVRPHLRYQTMYALPAKDRALFAKIAAFAINSLSGEAVLVAPVVVRHNLLRLDVRDYGEQFAKVYEELAKADPYFHIEAKLVNVPAPLVERAARRRPIRPRRPGALPLPRRRPITTARARLVSAKAPWLSPVVSTALAQETHSAVPVLRADWFWTRTAIQAGRKGTGYYDFLGLKSRADFEKLVGLDKKLAEKQKRETAAIVRKSGVAAHNRQIFRLGATDAGYWITKDVFDVSTQRRNAVRALDKDFQHDAEEHYGFLPNRLFAYYLSDKDGGQQESAPDKIGPDSTSTSNDGRIHVMLSCVRCHVEGIRPINDYARRLYTGRIKLVDPDYAKLQRLRQLYLGNLRRFERRDRDDFAESVNDLTGLKVAEVSAAYGKFWRLLVDTDVGLKQAAIEVGCTPHELLAALKWESKVKGKIDPILAGFLQEPTEPIARDQWEEVYGLVQSIILSYRARK